MPDNNDRNSKNITNNETQKKRSFFGGEINSKTKDMLDFRYNTQEEIDRLNEEMTTTDDLDKIMKQTNNEINTDENKKDEILNKEEDKKESELDLKQDGESPDELISEEISHNNEDYTKGNKYIEGEIVENPEFNEELENKNFENIDKGNNVTENINNQNNILNEVEEENASPKNDNVILSDNELGTDKDDNRYKKDEERKEESMETHTKFFDPFELTFDEEDEENEETRESNNQIFDPFGANTKDNEENTIDNNLSKEEKPEEENNNEVKEESKIEKENNDEEHNKKEKDNENDNENNEIKEENVDEIQTENKKEIEEENESKIEEKNNDEENDNENNEIEEENVGEIQKENNNEIKDKNNDEEGDDEERTNNESNETEEEANNDKLEEKEDNDEIEDKNDEKVEFVKDSKNDEKEKNNNEKDGIVAHNTTPENPNQDERKEKTIKDKKIKKNSATGEIITNKEIELEQGQDMPNTEEDEEHQISAEELFEQEPEFFDDDEISQQFMNLVQNVRGIFKLERKNGEQNPYFKIIGGKSDNSTLEYLFYLIEEENEPIDLYIKKVETDEINSEETEHLVQLSYNEDKKLNIFVDEIILYTEINKANPDSTEYNDTKTMLEKFIFLTENYYKELKTQIDQQRKEKQKKRQLQQIFKGF